ERSPDRGVAVGDACVVDVLPELPVDRDTLALPEQVRLVEPYEASEAVSLTEGCTEVHVAGSLLLDVEHDVDITLLVRGQHVRHGKRRLEESHVAETLVTRDEQVPAEDRTREKRQLTPDAGFLGVVVAEYVHAIDDRRTAFRYLPPEVDDGRSVATRSSIDDRKDARRDVAFVLVSLG